MGCRNVEARTCHSDPAHAAAAYSRLVRFDTVGYLYGRDANRPQADERRSTTMQNGLAFIDYSRRLLAQDYLPKIERCLEQLSDEEVWWRPNEASNSIGNLLLHLAGNIRQWIVSGVGGAPDVRRRQEEFDARTPVPAATLLARLKEALGEVDGVLAGLDPAALGETRVIQGHERTVLEAVYHVVEHFSMHTGQILYVTKLLKASDLNFYEVKGGVTTPTFRR